MKNELLCAIVDAIEDKKGEEIAVLDLRELDGAVCDYFVICSGNSTTQVTAIADGVERQVLENTREKVLRTKGARMAQWVAMDYGNIMVHVFLPEVRDYYRLEDLWADAKPVEF